MTGLEKIIAILATKKGILLGLLIGSMKVMADIRNGNVKMATLITDLLGAMVIGYASYEVISLTEVTELLKVIWTLFLSANAFLVVSMLSDKEIIQGFIRKYLKK